MQKQILMDDNQGGEVNRNGDTNGKLDRLARDCATNELVDDGEQVVWQ
jgi:hypothetical protein